MQTNYDPQNNYGGAQLPSSNNRSPLLPRQVLKTNTQSTVTDVVSGRADPNTGTVYGVSINAGVIDLDNPYKFSAYRANAQTPGSGAFDKVAYDTIIFDHSGGFDVTNNRYVVQADGFYFVSARQSANNPNTIYLMALYKNGSIWRRGNHMNGNSTQGVEVNTLLQLKKGDYIEIFIFQSTNNALEGTTIEYGTFDAYRVCAT